MTVLGFEGFEVDQSSALLAAKYDSASGLTTIDAGRLHGTSMEGTGAFRTLSFNTQNTLVIGFGLRSTSIFSNDDFPQIRFMLGLVEQFRLQFDMTSSTTFEWKVFRGAVQLGTTAEAFTNLNWHHFELKVVLASGTGGSLEIRHNEVPVLTVSGIDTVDTGSPGADIIDFSWLNNNLRIDDIYWLTGDVSENAGDDDFLGDSTVEGSQPVADGATTDWAPSSGLDHYPLLIDSNAFPAPTSGDDSSLVSSTTVGHIDLIEMADLSFITGTIHAVQITTRARLDAIGSRTLKHKARSGGLNFDGSQFVVSSTGYRGFVDVFSQDPNTAAAWTIPNVNAAEFGFEVVV